MKNKLVNKIVSFFSRTFKKPVVYVGIDIAKDGKWHTFYASQDTETSAKKKSK